MPPKHTRTSPHRTAQAEDEERDGAERRWAEGRAATAGAAAAAASSSAAVPASAAPLSSNPLVDLLCDLKCAICLGVVIAPQSLPCNHFFCATCLAAQMASDAAAAAAERKKKSNSTLRLKHLCPHCRQEYTKRNLVPDPLVMRMASLALELRRRPDLRELRDRDPDESLLELSQVSAPTPSPGRRITRRTASDTSSRGGGGMMESDAAAAAPSTPVRRHSSSGTAAAGASAQRRAHMYDPFAFHATETQVSSGGSGDKRPAASSAAASLAPANRSAAHPFSPAAAAAAIPSAATTPRRSTRSSSPRKSYREVEGTASASVSQEEDELQRQEEEIVRMQLQSQSEREEDEEDEQEGDESEREESDEDEEPAAGTAANALVAVSSAPSSASRPQPMAYKQLKGYPIVELSPGTCHVCCQHSEEEATVTCRLCKVSVHAQLCYAHTMHTLTAEERGRWTCDRCSDAQGTKQVSCAVCPNTDDQAFKKTDDGRWVHASCAMWIPELKYRHPDARQIVIVKGLDKDRFTVPCKFCRGKGAIIQCTFPSPKCSFSYHVPCGLRRGIEFELVTDGASQLMSQEEGADFVYYHNFCAKHAKKKHLVPACNSAIASRILKKKQQAAAGEKRKRGSGAAAAAADERAADESQDEVGDTDDSDSQHAGSAKRARNDSSMSRVNRTINLADTRMDTTDGSSNAATPARHAAGFSLGALVTPQTASPLMLHTPLGAAAAAASPSYAAAAFAIPAANRKLEFSTPSSVRPNITTSVGVSTRTSPQRSALPPMLRASSAGQLASTSAESLPPSRIPSLRGHGSEPQDVGAAQFVPPAAAAAAATPVRTPLRSLDRREVSARDNAAAAASSITVKSEPKAPASSRASARHAHASSAAAAGRLAKRHQLVIMGTRLDAEQQALLEEVVAMFNANAAAATAAGAGGGVGKEKQPAGVASARLVESWDETVTHVVTAASSATGFVLPTRTIKYFQGLLSSCWVLGIDWAAACLSQQRCASEHDYLVQGDAKLNGGELTLGAKRARNRERLFENAHFVLNMPFRQPLRKDIEQLITLGAGEVRDEFPLATGSGARSGSTKRGSTAAANAAASHSSDLDEASQDDSASQSASPAKASSRALTPALTERGRWYLLCDDTQIKNTGSGGSTRAQLRRLVSEQLWRTCEQRYIHVVGVSWLFDSISAFKLRPLPT